MLGRLEMATFTSQALRGNPLGDPAERSALLYLPPGYGRGGRFPVVYFLHGFTGSVHSWTGFSPFALNVPERLDELVASGAIPEVIGVFLDGWTAIGGTQWIDSPAVGAYGEYLARDAVSFVDSRLRTIPRPESRAVVGKSSGGYGALAMGRHHPEVFGHVASHAGDACFEYCYLGDFPKAAAELQGSNPETWLRDMRRRAREKKLRPADHPVLNVLAMAAHYSPRPGAPLGLELPFDPLTARIRPGVWTRWLEHDPVRYVPDSLEAFRRLNSLYLDCGSRDEFHLSWGTRMVVESLRAGGVEVTHEEFDDGHRDINYRYDRSLGFLVPRMARD
jgi:poly(3-hydroxybutyrate) depolymerase